MKFLSYISVLILFLSVSSCVKQFQPDYGIDPNLYVIEGLITDQLGRQSVTVSKSIPLGSKSEMKPVTGCNVWIMNDIGYKYILSELSGGTYSTASDFKGVVGRKYTLYVEVTRYDPIARKKVVDLTLQSEPGMMLPVPPIDSLYYQKVKIDDEGRFPYEREGCQILLNTSDPMNMCRYFRWDYSETWEIIGPTYSETVNKICWATKKSEEINTKAVTGLSENRINGQKIKFIPPESNRLIVRYRILVNQYSLDEKEYTYWNNLEKLTQQSGNIYDLTPSAVSGNMFCANNPDQPVLGYFSVSSKSSKSIYIDDYFKGLDDPYRNCLRDSILPVIGLSFPPPGFIENEGFNYWIVDMSIKSPPLYIIVTDNKGCIDCTLYGSTTKPDFWREWWELPK